MIAQTPSESSINQPVPRGFPYRHSGTNEVARIVFRLKPQRVQPEDLSV